MKVDLPEGGNVSEDELLAVGAINASHFVGEVSDNSCVGETDHSPLFSLEKSLIDTSSGPKVSMGQRRVTNRHMAQE